MSYWEQATTEDPDPPPKCARCGDLGYTWTARPQRQRTSFGRTYAVTPVGKQRIRCACRKAKAAWARSDLIGKRLSGEHALRPWPNVFPCL
jgi:hypothetical protein